MNIGISFPGLGKDLKEAYKKGIELKNKTQITAIEIWMARLSGEKTILWPWEFTKDVIKEMKGFLDNFEYKGAHIPFACINVVAPNPRIREESIKQIEESIKVSGELGLNYVVTHMRYGALVVSEEEEIRLYQEICAYFAELSQKYNILFTIEDEPVKFSKVVEGVNSPNLGLTLDVGHCNGKGAWDNTPYKSTLEFINDKAHLIKHVHLHDNHGLKDEHLPPGEGNIDFPSIITLLINKGYDGGFILECSLKEYGFERIKKAIDYIRNLILCVKGGGVYEKESN